MLINIRENLFRAGIAKFANATMPAVAKFKTWYTTKVIHVLMTKLPMIRATRAMKF